MNIKNTKSDILGRAIDLIGIALIGAVCLCYSLFWSNFAELHIKLPFLDFPIFVGEILLFWCAIFLAVKWALNGFAFSRSYWFLIIYIVWLLVRALHGYSVWGPLALRNAALFYYPLFLFAGFQFYRKEFFRPRVVYALFLLLLLVRVIQGPEFMYYFLPPYVLLSLVLIFKMPSRIIRWIALALLVWSIPMSMIFNGSRSYILANLVTILFFFVTLILGLPRFKMRTKILGLAVISAASIFVFLRYAPPGKVQSLTTPRYLIEEIKAYDELIEKNKEDYVPREIPAQIYNPNTNKEELAHQLRQEKIRKEVLEEVAEVKTLLEQQKEEILAAGEEEMIEQADGEIPDLGDVKKESAYFRAFQEHKNRIMKKVFPEVSREEDISYSEVVYFNEQFGTAVNASVDSLILRREVVAGRTLQTEYANILFRIFIWRDMVREILKEKAWFGLSFGHPQRSVSLENAGFAAGEWGRDGWVAPHNAFLHMIYRAGIVGLGMVIGMFAVLFIMTKEFIQRRSIDGLLLVSILIYWIVLSSFLVVLELPYQSIPFWTLWGMILAYLYKDKRVINPT